MKTTTFSVKYTVPVKEINREPLNIKDYEMAFKDIIKARMRHCKESLEKAS